jgi:hypothetical protein
MDMNATATHNVSRTTELPNPSRSSRWRWTTTRSAALCGGALLGALTFRGVARAATTHTGKPPNSAHGQRPNGTGMAPTASGKITALSGHDITISGRNSSTETVIYSSTTKFETRSGTTTASALILDEFINVQGTKAPNGDVTATTVMIGSEPPGGRGGPPDQGGPPKAGTGPKG